ncbi:MAG: hypothetical protein QM775_21800 [Pirellulales bacterium]
MDALRLRLAIACLPMMLCAGCAGGLKGLNDPFATKAKAAETAANGAPGQSINQVAYEKPSDDGSPGVSIDDPSASEEKSLWQRTQETFRGQPQETIQVGHGQSARREDRPRSLHRRAYALPREEIRRSSGQV